MPTPSPWVDAVAIASSIKAIYQAIGDTHPRITDMLIAYAMQTVAPPVLPVMDSEEREESSLPKLLPVVQIAELQGYTVLDSQKDALRWEVAKAWEVANNEARSMANYDDALWPVDSLLVMEDKAHKLIYRYLPQDPVVFTVLKEFFASEQQQ
jgi:hypothetical protein